MESIDLKAIMVEAAGLFPQLAAPLTEDQFANRPNERWSVGDTVQHLHLSARPVLRLLGGPRDVFAQWGTAEGRPRSVHFLKTTYKDVLGLGVKAPPSFSPRPGDVPDNKITALNRLTDTYLAIADQLDSFSNSELDQLQMPHPVLGMLSVREMIYFIGIHTRHHVAVLAAY